MTEPTPHEELVDEGLRMAAEAEMRRTAHPKLDSNARASKRAKTEGEEEDFIEVGRFDYSSVKEIAAGMTGFLATCDFRREKSCTREVTTLLHPYLLPVTDTTAAAATEETLLSNIKVSCRGLIVLKIKLNNNEKDDDPNLSATAKLAQQAVLKIYDAVSSATSTTATATAIPQFVQRLIPIISTCLLEEEALKACAARVAGIAALAFGHLSTSNDGKDTTTTEPEPEKPPPATFGIHINNRATGNNTIISNDAASNEYAAVTTTVIPLDRMQIISAVAAGLTTELKNKFNIDAKVNLKAPTVVVDVEVMPVMGKLYAGIAVLPKKVCTLKPKLGIKALRQNSVPSAGGKGGGNGGGVAEKKNKNKGKQASKPSEA